MATMMPGAFCPRCGAPLSTPRCDICREIAHLRYLLREIAAWQQDGTLDTATAQRLHERYRAEHDQLLIPPEQAPAVEPVPLPEPVPEPEPTEWDRLREATGFTWIYAVGALFIVAGLGWLIYLSRDHAWGRWVTAAVIAAAAGGSLAVGRWMRAGLGLAAGGEAMLAIGTLLTSAALFAFRDAAGLNAPALAPGCWAGGLIVALILAWQLRLSSQLALADLLGLMLSVSAARVIGGGSLDPPALLGLFLAPLAAGNLGLVVLLRRTNAAGLEPALLRTARLGAGLLILLATVAVVSSDDPFPPALSVAKLLAPLLLGGAILALAYELEQPPLVAAAAGAWLWFAYVLGALGEGLFWQLATIGGLLFAGSLERDRRREFGAWYLGAAVVATGILLAPRLPELIEGAGAWTAIAGWLLVGLYLATALVWRDERLLAPVVLLLVLAVLFTVSALGLPGRYAPAALALVALVQQLAAGSFRHTVWRERSVGETLAWLTLVPQILGLGVAGAMAAAGLFEPLTLAAVMVLCTESFFLSYQIGRSDLLYLTMAGGALAGLLIDRIWRIDLDPVLAATVCGWFLLAGALWQGKHLRPFEILATLLFAVLPWCRFPALLHGQLDATAAALLAALGLAVPALPGMVARSQLPVLNGLVRPTGAILVAALGAMGLSVALGFRPEVGPILVAGGAAAFGRYAKIGVWDSAAADAATFVAFIAGFALGTRAPAVGTVLLLAVAQAAMLANREDEDERFLGPVSAVGAVAQWLIVTAVWFPEEAWRLPLALLTISLGAWYIGFGRCETTPLGGWILLAVGYGQLGMRLAPDHGALWYLPYVWAAALHSGWLRGRGEAAQANLVGGIAVLVGIGASWVAAAEGNVPDTLALLAGETVLAVLLTFRSGLPVITPVVLANATCAYALYQLRTPDPIAYYGTRLAVLTLLNVLLAAALRRVEELKVALLWGGLLIAFGGLNWLLPAQRATVLALLCYAGAATTAGWLTRQNPWYDVGFGCAWGAVALLLYDAARHGRGELYPYRGLDLYVVPIGVYLLAVVERRAARAKEVRWTATLLILGSLLVSAFASEIVAHDVALFLAVFGAVLYGTARRDGVVATAGLVDFLAWAVLQVWRLRSTLSQAMLIVTLILLGATAMIVALRRERESRAEV